MGLSSVFLFWLVVMVGYTYAANLLHWENLDRTIIMKHKYEENKEINFTAGFMPNEIYALDEGKRVEIFLLFNKTAADTIFSSYHLEFLSSDESIIKIENYTETTLQNVLNYQKQEAVHPTRSELTFLKDNHDMQLVSKDLEIYYLSIHAKKLGRNAILAKLVPHFNATENMTFTKVSYTMAIVEIGVVREYQETDTAFHILIIILATVNALNKGFKTKLKEVKKFLKEHPTPVILGVATQLVLMPLISFTVCNIFEAQYNSFKLGLLVLANTPGSSLTKFFIVNTEGDTMLHDAVNSVSGLLVLGTGPAWLFLFGRFYLYTEDLHRFIKYLTLWHLGNIGIFFIGVTFYFVPQEKVRKILKFSIFGVQIVLLFIFLTFGLYCNPFWFDPDRSIIYAAAFLQSHLAQLIGLSIAVIFQQPICRVKTISLNTGMHNSIFAMVLVRLILPQPEADMSSMIAFAKMTTTNIFPLFCVFYYKCCDLKNHYRKFVEKSRLKKHAAHHKEDKIVTWIKRRRSIWSHPKDHKDSVTTMVSEYISTV